MMTLSTTNMFGATIISCDFSIKVTVFAVLTHSHATVSGKYCAIYPGGMDIAKKGL